MTEKKLRIVFMGTPEFAVASLKALLNAGYNIVGVITAPDKPAGRGQTIQQSAVKEFAIANNLKVLQPSNLKDENFLMELKGLKADLQIVVAFRMLPEVVWNMPPLGTYNLHGSLLPKYRGAAPINWSVINGDTETGVTTFKLTHEIDTGNILFSEKLPIAKNETAGEVHDKLMNLGATLIKKTVDAINDSFNNGTALNFIQQNDAAATHAPKIFKEHCKINWNTTNEKVYNLIRGLSPYPAAFTQFTDKTGNPLVLKIYKAKALSEKPEGVEAGTLLTDNKTYMHVCTADGMLDLEELQLQGKKKMKAIEFLNGYKFPEHTLFK